jgi:hypothetical protein
LTRRFRCWRTHSPTRRSDVPLGSFRKSHIRWITLRGGHMVDDVESCLTLDRRTTHLSSCANRSFLDFISSKMTKTSCPKSLVSMHARRLTERGIQARDWEIAGSTAPAPAPRSLPQQFPMRNKNGQPSCSDPLPISRVADMCLERGETNNRGLVRPACSSPTRPRCSRPIFTPFRLPTAPPLRLLSVSERVRPKSGHEM